MAFEEVCAIAAVCDEISKKAKPGDVARYDVATGRFYLVTKEGSLPDEDNPELEKLNELIMP